ncbi:thioesterase [Roseibium aquae]|uniref:Thioesterase n=1 Tax=Roseibium aquae TaxID=1323746 RepID=A0A916THD1_9HYPH|nr:thioesterase family protein [Roseibium aquae]GGB45029.1 thioesterase [Roseibium aquae]
MTEPDNATPAIEAYPVRTRDKLRYADTDRQGHVNNAVFATFLETGRVEFLYDETGSRGDAGCTFVIAKLELEFLREINWPGDVEIGTRVAHVGRSSFALDQGVFQNGVLAASARTVIVQMNEETRRSHPLSDALSNMLKKLG